MRAMLIMILLMLAIATIANTVSIVRLQDRVAVIGSTRP